MTLRLSMRLAGFLTALFPLVLWGGQSLVMAPGLAPVSVPDPVYAQNRSYRIEFQLHSFVRPAAGVFTAKIFQFDGLGVVAWLYPDGTIGSGTLRDKVAIAQPCFTSTQGITNALVRLQRDVTKMQFTCEVWNYDGTAYNDQISVLQSLGSTGTSGGQIGVGVTGDLGFLRVYTTLVPLGGRPPVTADHADYTDLKFDSNLNDSGGSGHRASGSATYAPTPNQGVFAYPKTSGAPFWTNWLSLRAGFPGVLDGSASYSLSDASAAVSYSWQQINGPTTLLWSSRASATPQITGLVFGTYNFQLQVTDASNNTATAPLEVGAVATDDNGVVVNADPNADKIFGPMIAFGRNPWGYADQRNLFMETAQQNTYAVPPTWSMPAEAATVSYRFFGVSPALTTLAASVTPASLTIPVKNVSQLDLTSFPTEILINNPGSSEVVRICSATGNTLTVCYDGRGFHYGELSYMRAATAWNSGTGVWQAKVSGNGSHFLRSICTYGVGWPVASNVAPYSTGTVTMTPGSTAVTGVGTAWTTALNQYAIAVSATHGGIPFSFLAYASTIRGATSLTLSRPFPADADPGSYSYHLFSDGRNVVLHYTRADKADGSIYFLTAGCESDTSLFLYGGFDNAYAGQLNPASPYSYMDGFGYAGDFDPNFYDMGLAHYAFYLRSGRVESLTAARNIEDYWIRYPEIAQGEAGGPPRDKSVTGVVAAAVLDGDRGGNWPGLRSFAQAGVTIALARNCDDDPRETAYQLSWLALAAEFDPDLAQRAKWQAYMPAAWARDNGCKGPDNSYPSGIYWNGGIYPQVVVTNGSQTATPASGTFPASMCLGVASGTAQISNGSATLNSLMGSFVRGAGQEYNIIVSGTINGVRYDLSTQFDYGSATTLTLAALWPGDTGTVYWMQQNNDPNPVSSLTTIATGQSDAANFGHIFACSLTDSTHMLLSRPWPGDSGTYGFWHDNLVGRGTQPFMMGIKTLQMRYAGQTYAPYVALDQGVATWVGTTGFDQALKAISYGRGFPQCEPLLTDSGVTDMVFRNAGCVESSKNPVAVTVARARNSEAQNSMTVNYLANPTSENQLLGDWFYGATYGATGYTANGYFTDGIIASNIDNGSLSSYKWPGFFFGIGMAHQWPAARLGGVAPAQPRTVPIGITLGTAASAQVVVTAPSGATTMFPCGSTSPCQVTVDDRQGSHWYRIQYLSDSGQVSSQSVGDLLEAQRRPTR
jgi:hypothetical protein